MDPALMNYLQQQQGSQGQPAFQEPPYNPFDTGIRAAINSARESLGMTQKQQDKALRSSMLSFANNIAQQPREKGFWNNVGQVGRALSPAIIDYDKEENAALNENNVLGNQILKYQGAEQDRQAKAEEQAFWRSHAQEQLGEQRRNHNLMDNFRKDQLSNQTNKANQAAEGQFGSDFIPINTAPVKNAYTKEKKSYGGVLKHVNDIIKEDTQIAKDYENDISPTGPFSRATAPVENFFGIIGNNKKLREKTAKRENFSSELVELKAGLERALKGGVLGPKVLEYFDNAKVYPTINDTPEVRSKKLATIQKKLNENYEAADLSLKYGVQIDPSNLDQFRNYLNPQTEVISPEQINNNQEPVIMKDPETGEEGSVPIERIQEALDDGLILVNE